MLFYTLCCQKTKGKKITMKKIIKFTSLLLIIVLFASSTSHACENSASNSEEITIEGVNYIYTYSFDSTGNRQTTITNTDTNAVDVLKTNDEATEFYINDELVATVDEELNDSLVLTRSWTSLGTSIKKISWIKGVAIATLAAIIASAIGGVSAGAVTARISFSALGVIASSSVGATVKTTAYKMGSTHVVSYKFVWEFTSSSGDKLGPFTTYSQG